MNTRQPITGRRGAVLLEVLVSLALLVFGLAVVGMQINVGLDQARSTDIGTRALMLAESKIAEINAGIVRPESNNTLEMKEDFGAQFPGYTWRLTIKPTDVDTFYMLTLEIGYNPASAEAQIASPEAKIDIEESGTTIVQTYHRLAPSPADVNLNRDFGISQDEMDQMQQQMQGDGTSGSGSGDQSGGGGTADTGGSGKSGGSGGDALGGAAGLDALLQMLAQVAGDSAFDPRMIPDLLQTQLANLPKEQLEQIQTLLEMMVGRRGGAAVPADQVLEQLLGNEGGKRGSKGGPPKPPSDQAGNKGPKEGPDRADQNPDQGVPSDSVHGRRGSAEENKPAATDQPSGEDSQSQDSTGRDSGGARGRSRSPNNKPPSANEDTKGTNKSSGSGTGSGSNRSGQNQGGKSGRKPGSSR